MPDETQTPVTEPTTDKPVKQPAPPPADPGVFTDEQQKRVDAIMGNARKEGSASALSTLAKELGYDSVDDMKAAAKDAKTRAEKDMSELEKATKRAEKAEAEKAEALALIETERAARIADKVDSALKEAATHAKASKPGNVVKWLRMEKKAAVEKLVGDDGSIDEKAVEKLIADFKKEEPSWFGVSGPGSPSNKDGRPPQPDASKAFGDKPLVRL